MCACVCVEMASGGCVPALTGLAIAGPPRNLLVELQNDVDRAVACMQSAGESAGVHNAYEHLVQIDTKLRVVVEEVWPLGEGDEASSETGSGAHAHAHAYDRMWAQSADATRHIVQALQDALTSFSSDKEIAHTLYGDSLRERIFVVACGCLRYLWWWEMYAVSQLSASILVGRDDRDAEAERARAVLHELAFLREGQHVKSLFEADWLPFWTETLRTYRQSNLLPWLSGTLGVLGLIECLRKGEEQTPRLLTASADGALDDREGEWLHKALYVRAHGLYADLLDPWLDGVMEWVFVDAPTPKTAEINDLLSIILERRRLSAQRHLRLIESGDHTFLQNFLDLWVQIVELLASVAMMGHVFGEGLATEVYGELINAVELFDKRSGRKTATRLSRFYPNPHGERVDVLLLWWHLRERSLYYPDGVSLLEPQALHDIARELPKSELPKAPTHLKNTAATQKHALPLWLFQAGWPMGGWEHFWWHLDNTLRPSARLLPKEFERKALALRALRDARRRAEAGEMRDVKQLTKIDNCVAGIAASYIIFYWEDRHEDVVQHKLQNQPVKGRPHLRPGTPKKPCPNRTLASPSGGCSLGRVLCHPRAARQIAAGPCMDFPTLMREVDKTPLPILAKRIAEVSVSADSIYIDEGHPAGPGTYAKDLSDDIVYMVDRLIFRHRDTDRFKLDEVSTALGEWLSPQEGLAPCAQLLSRYAEKAMERLFAPKGGTHGGGGGGDGGPGYQLASASFQYGVRRERSAEARSANKVLRTGAN